jgi:very-short-patch-repair endonuclease
MVANENKTTNKAELPALADEQYGLWTRAQLRGAGVSWRAERRKVDLGEWEIVHGRVVRAVGATRSFRSRTMEATLAFDAVASHRTAAALYGVGGIRPAEIEISRMTGWNGPIAGVTIHRPRYLPDEDVVTFHGIPATSPARTTHDLGAVVGPRVVKRAVEDTINKKLASEAQLHDHLKRWGVRGWGGTSALRTALAALGGQDVSLESDLEEELLKLLTAQAISGFKTQQNIVTPGDIPIGRVDVLFPRQMVVIEALGYEWHSSLVDFLRDHRRRNELEAAGYIVLAFLWDDVARPRAFLRVLRAVLAARDSGF